MEISFWKSFKKGYTSFTDELKKFGIKTADDFKTFQKKHPKLDKAIKISVSFLPFPFNEIGKAMYEQLAEKDKTGAAEEIFNYLKQIRDGGENNFKSIASAINSIVLEGAKEKTLVTKCKSILENQKLIIDEVKKTGKKIDVMNNEMAKDADLQVLKEQNIRILEILESKKK